MTSEERSGLAPSPAPPESQQALTEDIDRTRQELGETVEALVARADVKARARDKTAEVAGRVSSTASQAKEQAAARVGAASAAAPEPVRRAASRAASIAQQRQVLVAVAVGGALLAGWLTVRQRRR